MHNNHCGSEVHCSLLTVNGVRVSFPLPDHSLAHCVRSLRFPLTEQTERSEWSAASLAAGIERCEVETKHSLGPLELLHGCVQVCLLLHEEAAVQVGRIRLRGGTSGGRLVEVAGEEKGEGERSKRGGEGGEER